jgi:ATP-dependent DNA helicase PIF1
VWDNLFLSAAGATIGELMRQKQALNVMMGGSNVFLTGAPGAGKTYVLGEFVGRAMRAGKRVAVTASTGIAATHIGGTTIHSWSGLGIRDYLTEDDRRWLGSNDRLMKRYNSVDVLVIDEVSMLHGSLLDIVNQAAKLLRQNPAPFGGLQVILVGDLFQLPPINRGGEALDFIHQSEAWAELNPEICYLTEQHRQQDSDGLLNLLEAMRRGELNQVHEELLQERLSLRPMAQTPVTRLYSHNVDVDAINQRHLTALTGEARIYGMVTKGRKARVEQLVKSVLAPETLVLKVDTEVMFVVNNFADGFANGSRGRIVDFTADNMPVVKLTNGRVIVVEPHSWSLSEDGRVRAEAAQLPLRLAWAITIHKSQGMSLDAAEVDLSRAFTPGMGYVALSRVRSLEGLYLQGINQMALAMHPQIFSLDAELRRAATLLAEDTDDISEEVISATDSDSKAADEDLFEELKAWRYARARTDKIPPFMVAHNTALLAVAATAPNSLQQLLALPGFGKRKVEVYGPEILAVVQAYQASQ